MKRLLAYVAALSLVMAPTLSLAQTPKKGGGGGGKPASHTTHTPSNKHTVAKPGPRPGHGGPGHVSGGHGPRPGHGGPGHVAGRPVYGHGVYHGPRGNRFYYNGHYFGRIHGGPWAWPGGYGYHRFYIGGILPAIFLGSAYVYADYLALGLAAPDPGFVWVRYGPDLVLVNQATGQIVQVAYGVFL
jgi:Ni/Co efflux regulator RcnB